MRVLQAIAGGEHGGAEAFFVRLAIALDRAGVEQRLVVRRGRAWAAGLREAKLIPVELPFGGAFDLVTRPALKRSIAEFRPEVVLSWMSRATAMAARPGRRDHVHVARLGGYYPLKSYRGCDHLVGNTRDIVAYLIAAGWPADRAHYLPNFVTDARAAAPVPRSALDTPEGAPLALALGRLHRNKGFDVLIAALASLPETYLWLSGDGPERDALVRQAEEAGVAPRVRFLGWRDDVAALLAAADVLACPSRVEPLGNVVIEAWSAGTPVVAADVAGPRALIVEGDSGLLVPVEDAPSLAAAIGRITAERRLAAALAAGGRSAFEAAFTEAAVVRQYCDFFDRVTR